jgi:hypothetical protein
MVRQHGLQLQLVNEASKEHATRSKGTQEDLKYRSRRAEGFLAAALAALWISCLDLRGVGRFLCDFGFVIVPQLDHLMSSLVKKRRAQICNQIQRFIKIPTGLRRQTRTSTTHTKHKRSTCSHKPN